MRYQNESTSTVARFLKDQPAVAKVSYPGLESHPQFLIASEMFDAFGGVLSFKLNSGLRGAARLLELVKLPIVAPSLGGMESLITRPATTFHSGLSPEERRALGIGDDLIRLSVGLEATEDLIEDLEQAIRGVTV